MTKPKLMILVWDLTLQDKTQCRAPVEVEN